jgi:hypothetical protein
MSFAWRYLLYANNYCSHVLRLLDGDKLSVFTSNGNFHFLVHAIDQVFNNVNEVVIT